jgi:hypothetical protein
MAMGKSKISQAYEKGREGFKALHAVGRSAHCTEDRVGVVWERFALPNGEEAVIVATPSWWDVFVPLTAELTGSKATEAIAERAAMPHARHGVERTAAIETALRVLVTTPGVRAFLEANDAKALEQAERALAPVRAAPKVHQPLAAIQAEVHTSAGN